MRGMAFLQEQSFPGDTVDTSMISRLGQPYINSSKRADNSFQLASIDVTAAVSYNFFHFIQYALPAIAFLAYLFVLVRKTYGARTNNRYQTVPAVASYGAIPPSGTRLSTEEDEVPSYERGLLGEAHSRYSALNTVYDSNTGLPLAESELKWSRLDAIRVVLSFSVCILAAIQMIRYATDSFSAAGPFALELLMWIPITTEAFIRLRHGQWNNARPSIIYLCLFYVASYISATIDLAHQVRTGTFDINSLNGRIVTVHYHLIFFLFCTAAIARTKPVVISGGRQVSHESGESFLAYFNYGWITPIIHLGYKRPLQHEDLWELRPEEQADTAIKLYRKHKRPSLLASLVRVSRNDLIIQLSFSTVYAIMSFSMPFFMNLLLNYVSDPTSATPTMAMLYAVGMFVGSVVMSSTGQRAYWIGRRISVRIRAILSSELFIKSLRRRVVAKSKAATSAKAAAVVIDDVDTSTEEQQAEIINHTKDEESKNDEESDDPADIGSITNLLSVDANSIGDISAHLHQMWVMPIQVVLSLVFLWKLLGASTIIGSLVIAPLFYISGLASSKYTSLQERLMKTTDKRLAASNEVLQGIRIIKLFAWEQQFRERVMIKRENELVNVWKQLVMLIYFTVLGFATPAIITLATFGAHTLLFGNTLTASTAFTSLALLNILHETMDQLPEAVAWTLQGYVSLNRISKFLDEPDIEDGISTDYRDINTVNSNEIGFENANVQWDEHQEVAIDADTLVNHQPTGFKLTGLNMKFPTGQFSIIVGPTGAGKSSLLHALLGEMRCTSGKVLIPRRPLDNTIFSGSIDNVAYVAQQAWLQNLSIRDNILFGQEYEEDRYNQVVFACALKRDLEILDAGDSTEIGEKGVTLSGGQKQRVSLARAMYSSAKHILLDDCLSAVDAHTAKHIVEHCLQGPLMQGRTRILVTHHVELCAHSANFIVTMQEGCITGQGSLESILAAGLLPELANSSVPPTRQPSPVSGTATPQNDSKIALGSQSSSETDISETDGEKAIVTKKKSSNGVSGKLTEEEERQQGSVGFSIYHTYIQASGGYGAWSVIILLYIISQTVIIMQTYWLRNWATSNETGGEDAKQYAGYYLSIYAGLGILAMATAVIRNMMLYYGSLKASRSLFTRLLDRILYAKLRFFDVTPIGRIMNRFSKDIEMIDVEVAPCFAFFLLATIEAISIILAISFVTPKFLIAGIFIAFAYVTISTLYITTSRELKRIESVSKSPLFTLFGESLNGVGTIRAFGAESRFMRLSIEHIDTMNRPYYHLWAANRWLSWRTDTFGAFVSFFAAFFILYAPKSMDAGLAGFSLSFAVSFVDIMMWFIHLYANVEMNMNSIERVQEYLDIEQEAPAIIEDNRVNEHWPESGEVKVESLVIQYTPEHDPVIQDLSFSVQPGERVGIVGRTGAGKSTLAISLFRFVEATSGRIIVDDVDISKIGLQDLRSHLTIIPQDPILFNGTIRSNVDPFSSYDDESIWNALRRSHLIDDSDNRPPGLESLDSPVSENGSNFSQGQRQLLAMARALLRTNKLIIMDEATASVDFDTDTKIQQTIREEFSQATLLCIAHRLRTIIDYDKVLVMDAGRMVEYDSPYSLIQKPDSLFRQLCERSGEFETLLELASAAKGAGSAKSIA